MLAHTVEAVFVAIAAKADSKFVVLSQLLQAVMVQCEFEVKTLKADADSVWVVLGFAEYVPLVDSAMSLAGTDEPPLAGLGFGVATRPNPADSE